MKKENRIIRFLKRILKIKSPSKPVDIETKQKMCMSAINSGVCPGTCGICAWNTMED